MDITGFIGKNRVMRRFHGGETGAKRGRNEGEGGGGQRGLNTFKAIFTIIRGIY